MRSFDDIVRNLLVFLKGQVPSLQSKTSCDDVIRQVQHISYSLRTSIIQLEGAAYADPSNTEEFKALQDEVEGLKKANQKIEESLFLEVNKSKRFKEEIEILQNDLQKRSSRVKASENELRELEDKIRLLEAKPPETVDTAAQERLQAEIDGLKHEKTGLEDQLGFSQNQVRDLKDLLQQLEIEKSKLEDTVASTGKLETLEISNLKTQLNEAFEAKRQVGVLQAQIRELEQTVSETPSRELYQNNIAAAEAKIAFLEKALSEARRQLSTAANPDTRVDSDRLSSLLGEKRHLEQRIIDLEATLRRLMTARPPENEKPSTTEASISPEDFVFFFELFQSLQHRLTRSPENRDLLKKSEQAIELLEKARAIETIQTTGFIFEERLHKPLKSYHCNFLEDRTIIHEVAKGFKSGSNVIQRAVVWISKSVFACAECSFASRPHDNFCPQCGLELCSPDGMAKRNLQPLPTDPEIIIPLMDSLMSRNQFTQARGLFNYIVRSHPDHPGILKRGNMIANSLNKDAGSERARDHHY